MKSTLPTRSLPASGSPIPKAFSLRLRLPFMRSLERRVGEAIKLFWLTRDKQSESQGAKTGQKDAGLRAAVPAASTWMASLRFVETCSLKPACPKPTSIGNAAESCRVIFEPKRAGTWWLWPRDIYWRCGVQGSSVSECPGRGIWPNSDLGLG